MSKIRKAFADGKAFISFITAGDPGVDQTAEFVLTLAEAGSDLIELGVPFSDPIAEGVVIEKANERALAAGTTTDMVFDMMLEVRKKTQVPIVFLTYMNPVFVYGTERFFEKCAAGGVDGVIIPDLPFEEKGEVSGAARRCGVDVIGLIAPTSKDRVQMLAKDAEGFIYAVSSMGVTGVREEIDMDSRSMMEAIRSVTDAPVAVGFGISTTEQAKDIAAFADGVIVGSAIVKLVEEHGADAGPYLYDYVKKMKASIQ